MRDELHWQQRFSSRSAAPLQHKETQTDQVTGKNFPPGLGEGNCAYNDLS